MHHGKRAFGVGTVDDSGKWEVGAEAVVAALVVEFGADPHEPFADAELEGCLDDDLGCLRRAVRTGNHVADRMSRPRIGRCDACANPGRSRVKGLDHNVVRTVNNKVVFGRGIVVGVASIATVDISVRTMYLDTVPCDDRKGPILGVDRDVEVFVAECLVRYSERAWRSGTLDRPQRRPTQARHRRGLNEDFSHRRRQHGEPEREFANCKRGKLVTDLLQVDESLSWASTVKTKIEDRVIDPRPFVAGDVRSGELRAPHHFQYPSDLLPDHRGREAEWSVFRDCLRDTRNIVRVDEVHRACPGNTHGNESATVVLCWVHDQCRRVGRDDLGTQHRDRATCETVANLACCSVAHKDLIDNLVSTTGARRIMCGVQDELTPCLVHKWVRVPLWSQEQGTQRFGTPFKSPFGSGASAMDIDPIRRHAHQHIGAGPRPQFPAPGIQRVCGLGGQVLRKRRNLDGVVVLQSIGACDDLPQPCLGQLVVGAVHQQHAAIDECSVTHLQFVTAYARE